MKPTEVFVAIWAVITLALGVGTLFNAVYIDEIKREAVERGYAIHCPEDGIWRWKEQCEGVVSQ
jgi:hypothetical protein